METMGLKGGVRIAASVLGLVVAAGEAHAGGFQLKETTADGVATSFAGQAAKGYDASTVWNNPAGMMLLKGSQLYSTNSLVMPYSSFTGSASLSTTAAPHTVIAPIRGTTGGDAIGDGLVGGFYGVYDFSPDVKLGLAVVSPFGLRSKYPDSWVGRYQALDSALANFQVQPTIAFRVSQALSIGVGLDISYTTANLGTMNGNPLTGANIGRFGVKGNSTDVGYNIGLLYEFSPTTRVGVDYRSRIHASLDGDATQNGVKVTTGNAKITLPDVVSVGFYHDLTPDLTLLAEAEWTHWSLFKQLRVDFVGLPSSVTTENWRDGWFFSLGANYKIMPATTLQFGVGYEIGPVTDTYRTARIPDTDRIWTSIGAAYEFAPNHKINLAYAHLFGVGSGSIDHLTATTTPGVSLETKGSYSGHADIVSVGYQYKF